MFRHFPDFTAIILLWSNKQSLFGTSEGSATEVSAIYPVPTALTLRKNKPRRGFLGTRRHARRHTRNAYATITILSLPVSPGQEVHLTFSFSPWRTYPRLLPNPDSRRRVAVFDPN